MKLNDCAKLLYHNTGRVWGWFVGFVLSSLYFYSNTFFTLKLQTKFDIDSLSNFNFYFKFTGFLSRQSVVESIERSLWDSVVGPHITLWVIKVKGIGTISAQCSTSTSIQPLPLFLIKCGACASCPDWKKCLHYAEVLGEGDAPKFRRKGLCAEIILPSHASCAENFQGLLMAAGCSHALFVEGGGLACVCGCLPVTTVYRWLLARSTGSGKQ